MIDVYLPLTDTNIDIQNLGDLPALLITLFNFLNLNGTESDTYDLID